MHHRTPNRMLLMDCVFPIAIGASLVLVGCAPTTGGSMNDALTEYQSQQYDAAHDEALLVMAKSTGSQRERAAYLAGLSAYQAGDFTAADRDLSVASVSNDPTIAGPAKAMFGQLRLDQRRPREAAACFADASRLLQGEDARQAAWHAGLAYRQAGDEANARRWLDMASSQRFDQPSATTSVATTARAQSVPPVAPTLSSSSNQPKASASTTNPKLVLQAADSANVGFSLQVGAFSDKQRAKAAAEQAEDLARNQSLGRVKVIPRRDMRGQPVYMVHVGWWATRSEANAARSSLGRLEFIVAPAPAE